MDLDPFPTKIGIFGSRSGPKSQIRADLKSGSQHCKSLPGRGGGVADFCARKNTFDCLKLGGKVNGFNLYKTSRGVWGGRYREE